MHTYKFRVLLEDVDDFYRDIEIMANSTFEDLHKAIYQSVDFDGKEMASFYLCDSKWNRRKEIALIDMSDEGDENPPLVMNKCKLAEYIDDPHQRMIYVYDFLNFYEFNIELLKIFPAEKKVVYPRCIKKNGIIPKPGIPLTADLSSIFEEETIFVENEDFVNLKDEEDPESLGFYSDINAASGFAEEQGEFLENEKL
ncbi:MAG: plasmid pRiA4b ORF-3 family protein [Bacteroidetes bacterium]|nr:plasmid pRiA4b ORF-3 family protein [Bacteroidota bacterium]